MDFGVIWSAFILGTIGSLHCAAMCGPLMLALPSIAGKAGNPAGMVLHHAGRLTAYAVIGLLFGLAGQSLELAGFQRWLSLIAGGLLLAGIGTLFAPVQAPLVRLTGQLRAAVTRVWPKSSAMSRFGIGLANGFLPCGLVYAAGTASIAAGSWRDSVLFMLAFGGGTLPMLLGIAAAGRKLWTGRIPAKLLPATMGVTAVLLILRGLSLGVPYLSPDLSTGQAVCASCLEHTTTPSP